MTVKFVRAVPPDAQALVAVEIASFHDDSRLYGVPLDGPPGYDNIDVCLKKMREDDYYKIVLDGRIIGGFVVVDMGEGHMHLDLIFIDPAYHNRGIGTQAMEFIEASYAATKWTLNTPGYAIRNQHFYEKFGYVKVGEADYEGFVLLDYEKVL